jgi:integrase
LRNERETGYVRLVKEVPAMSAVSLVSSVEVAPPSPEQQLEDHRQIVRGYLDTHITRNHAESTRRAEKHFLRSWFAAAGSSDGRPLSVWEAMEPIAGRERIVEYARDVCRRVAGSTARTRLGTLRRLFEYVLDWPYIPGTRTAIQTRYGPIEQPVLEYDYPLHAWGGRREDAPLVRVELTRFYEALHRHVTTKRSAVAARTYTMCVLAAESGLRLQELLSLEVDRDLLFESKRIQTRAGKGTRGSGPRVRQTILSPFAEATLRHYLDGVRPSFKRWSVNPTVFLSHQGRPLSKASAASALRRLLPVIRKAGVRVPPRFAYHSLRRSFATIFAEENPGSTWTLMEMLGHSNPSTLSTYVLHPRNYHDAVIDTAIEHLVPRR